MTRFQPRQITPAERLFSVRFFAPSWASVTEQPMTRDARKTLVITLDCALDEAHVHRLDLFAAEWGAAGMTDLVLDCSAVRECTRRGLAELVRLKNHVEALSCHGTFAVVGVSDDLAAHLGAQRLTDLLAITPAFPSEFHSPEAFG
jgi:anti-anti-sigma regulatory factor